MLLDFDDISIIPSEISYVESRKDINPFIENNSMFIDNKSMLPIITAPMHTVVDGYSSLIYLKNKIQVCMTRGERNIGHLVDHVFSSMSLVEFKKEFIDNYYEWHGTKYICIDMANGHMKSLCDNIAKAKGLFGNKLCILTGNIANPKTYKLLSEAGASYIRCSIGSGNACLTSQQTAINYPIASLIIECRKLKEQHSLQANIVADGGMRKYSDIIKALGLGADLCMVGSLFNKSLESAGDTYLFNRFKINQYSNFAQFCFEHKIPLYKKFMGMSTKEVQKQWGNKTLKTSEGIVTSRRIEYKLSKWVENFEDYLRSCMSYTNSRTLNDFIGKVEYQQISNNAYGRFNK